MSYLLVSKLFCTSVWTHEFKLQPPPPADTGRTTETAQTREEAFNLIYLNPIRTSPRELPSCLSGESGRVNCRQPSFSDRASPVPGHEGQLCCNSALSKEKVQPLARCHSSSVTARHRTLRNNQVLGGDPLKLTFSCFSCFDSFSFSFFGFFFAVTFPSTSSPFLFLIEKNKSHTHERKLFKCPCSSYHSSVYWLLISAEAWIFSVWAGKAIFQIPQC